MVTMPQKSSNTTNISALPDRELRSKWQTKRGATLDSKLAAININRNMKARHGMIALSGSLLP